MISSKDKQVLRDLASKISEFASRDIEEEKRSLWLAHNKLEKTRPLIFCDPENGWSEIISDDMVCESDLARSWEWRLRKEIYWAEYICDDKVISPFFDTGHAHYDGDWGIKQRKYGGENGGAYNWEAPIKSYSDMDKMHYPEPTVDPVATENMLSLAKEVFNGLITVRLRTFWWWTLGITMTLIKLRGLQEMMLDMLERPEDLHRLMACLRDGNLYKLDTLEKNGWLSLNNDDAYVGSGGFGFTDELPQPDYSGRVRTMDMWGFGESQETLGVSPAQFEEFVFQYQLPILSRFGLNCYGCCEPLEDRWHIVKEIPRLRRVSVSPWADVDKMAENLGADYIFSYKPSPMPIAANSFDEDAIRKGLREVFEKTKGCRVEVVMKDNHTIANDPQRVVTWARIAREESERTG